MTQQTSKNKQVAYNTLFLYFRMILIMFINFYTARVILVQLGIEDYGIYNVVGGIVTMFSFLNGSMSTSTQRFLTIELGKENQNMLTNIFSTALNIHIFIATIIILLSETVGVTLLNSVINIPKERLFAANWVFQLSILTFCTNIIQVPYNAILIAHEKMNIYAYISILEVALKLGIVYLLAFTHSDKLILYALLIFLSQFIIRIIYQIYCRKHFEECHYKFVKDKKLYKQMGNFAGWNLMGSLAWILRDQGINLILNIFFGPAINAARGIASQVSGSIMGFISNFQIALSPQITKYYATNEIDKMEKISYQGIKLSFCILYIIALPFMLNIEFILNIWLKEVPQFASYFLILILIDSLVSVLFGNPLMISLSATGRIRKYQIVTSLIIFIITPVCYIALKLGGSPQIVFYILILFSFISGMVRFYFCHKLIGYSTNRMINEILIPILKLIILSVPIPLIIKFQAPINNKIIEFLLSCSISLCCAGIVIWYVALKKNERSFIVSFIRKKEKV